MDNLEPTPEENIDKYKQLYAMAESAFRDEYNRYIRIEDELIKYVPVIVFLFYCGGFFGRWALDKLILSPNWLEKLAIVCVFAAFCTLIYAALLLLWSHHSGEIRQLRPDDRDVEFFATYDLPKIYSAYALRFNEERATNAKITDKKARLGNRVYRMIFYSCALFILTGLIYVIHTCMNSKWGGTLW